MSTVELPKFNLHYCKSKPVDFHHLVESYDSVVNDEIEYNPYRLDNIQTYNPIYSELFDLTPENYNQIHLNNVFQFVDMNITEHQTTTEHHKQPIFIKYSPLIDPIRYMAGKYEMHRDSLCILPAMPRPNNLYSKIECPNNAAYTDTFFNFLSSKLLHSHGAKNCIDYYGSFLAIQTKFKMNITDDIEYLSSSTFFNENRDKLFELSNYNNDDHSKGDTRMNRNKIHIANTPKHNITAVSLSSTTDTVDKETDSFDEIATTLVYEGITKPSDQSSPSDNSCCNSDDNDTESDEDADDADADDADADEDADEDADDGGIQKIMNSDSNSNSNNSSSDDDDDDDDDEWEDISGSSDDDQTFAYIHNFPVQLICQEKCMGTIDELFEQEKMGCDESLAAMFQIIMTLLCYQKAFRFTHNDLHTNNIMFVHTNSKHLYYKYENTTYKVPTFGRIFKIIDFGRSIYYYRNHTFCSDSFAPNGDAHTQYNCEPYLSSDKPRIDPNYSFDLCRLGCSIFDFIMDIGDSVNGLDAFQRTIMRWCTDDNDKHILYKKNGDERYPHFKLYKMIARTVHNHTPKEQLAFPEFSGYALPNSSSASEVPNDADLINIDMIPSYA
jgi:hypothetical protein